jgi:outer membrane lipoprotein SlyB
MEPRLGQDFSRVRVHTDERAAESARAVNAQAYTVGRDVVFGAGQYQPNSQSGAWLLAHELTHVAQQSGSDGSVQALSLEPDNSHAEQQATQAANSIMTGRPVPGVTSFSGGMTVQRSVAGAIGGGLLGAGVGAAIGSLLGPVGAIIGGLIGGIAGLIAGETSTANAREVSSDEQKEAEIVFGSSMDWGKVRFAESAIMSIGGYARTPFNTVYLPPGYLSKPLAERMPLLIHELTHVWQTQHGYSVIEKLFYALHGAGIYKYGEEAGLREATAKGKRFKDFNTEQQGDICMDYYVKKKAGEDVSVYLPFIAEVQGLGSALNRPTKDMGDFPTPADEKTRTA